MAKKDTYNIRLNPKTMGFIRNREVYCGRCYENFGNIGTLELHRTDGGSLESKCLPPKSVGLVPQRNFDNQIVWRANFT